MIRASIIIGGNRLSDNDFTNVSITQVVGNHHNFEIHLRQEVMKDLLPTKVKSWIGQRVQIGIGEKAEKEISYSTIQDIFIGIITSIGLSRLSGQVELIVRGESPTIIMEDGPDTKSFSYKSLQEIADEVIKPYSNGFPEKPKVSPKVFTRSLPYCVQYKESGFAFLSRLANRYGEWFFYDGLNLYFGKPAEEKTITLNLDEKGVKYFDISTKALSSKFKASAYDYEKHQFLSAESPFNPSSSDLGEQVLNLANNKIFTHVPSFSIQIHVDNEELKNIAERREQVNLDEMVILKGSSSNSELKLGAIVELKDNELNESYGSFVIINISHDIRQGGDYTNFFEGVPVEVGPPPLSRIPDPPFCETQLAQVSDIDDDKGLGRVRVKFLWQEGTSEKSPWIRVASPYTGKDKGFYIIPEVGDQVLVAFENNHPDKPYVLAGMYNGEAKPEWFESKNRFKGFKSRGGNKWKFDDQKQEIQIHAPSSILMTAGNTIAIRSGKKGDDSSIVMKEGKEITVKTNGKPDSTITVDAGEGTVIVRAKKVTIQTTDLIEMQSRQDITANATVKLDVNGKEVDISGAVVNIAGNPINLNS
jgi:type VI secretion system secreted protein VgrG